MSDNLKLESPVRTFQIHVVPININAEGRFFFLSEIYLPNTGKNIL